MIGSFIPGINKNGSMNLLCAVWTNGKIEFYFQWLTRKAPFLDAAGREELRHRAETLLQTPVTDDMLARRPNSPLIDFATPDDFARLTNFFDWLINRVKES